MYVQQLLVTHSTIYKFENEQNSHELKMSKIKVYKIEKVCLLDPDS